MAGRQDHSVGGGGMDPELALKDRVDLEHAGDKEAQKFAPREDNYDPTSDHAKGSSGEKVCIQDYISLVCKLCCLLASYVWSTYRLPVELLRHKEKLAQPERTTALLLLLLLE